MILAALNQDFLIPLLGGTVLFGLLVTFIIYFIILHKRSQNKFIHEQNELRQALLTAEIEIKEQTLLTVSRELHDNYGQIASLIKINLNMLSTNLSAEDRKKVDESLILIRQLIVDIKSLATALRGDTILQVGWIKMIEKDVQRVNAMGETRLTFSYPDPAPVIEQDKQVILYRVVQEMINNLLKHAHARESSLLLTKADDGRLTLEYTDNGKGFNPGQVVKKNGLGLDGMYERCAMIGADVELSSQPGSGTRIKITLK